MSMLQEFKEFAMRGNVVDLAVGVIMGTAFNKIVTSLVNDVVMPPIGYAIGGVKFSDLKHPLPEMVIPGTSTKLPPVTINYGNFLQATFDFLIVAFCVFLLVKVMNRLMRKKVEAPKPPEPAPPAASPAGPPVPGLPENHSIS